MSSIDQRVVEMKFDNAAFAQGVKNTQDQLKGLKESLKLDGAAKGLQDVESASRGFTLGSIGTAVEGIASKFSAMSIIGITALTNITNKAINAGEQMAKSLTIAPVKAGFDEYELKMGSIQTILSNTARYGTQLPEVTANLDELNTYADKTIYNFGDMTKNIGLFTNAGIKVGDATQMIKGFSNEAAASGTSAEGASGAAYQLSQALSAGKVTLMDWRSLQNVGMGNKNMQNGIIELAKSMGTFEGSGTSAEKATKDFNGSLEKGWLKADVMSNYLKIMAGDMDTAKMKSLGLSDATIDTFTKQQKMSEEAATKVRTWSQLIGTVKESVGSGWTDTFGILFGDFNEATDLFTGINNVVGDFVGNMSDARNNLLKGWKDLGGRTALIDGLKNTFQTFAKPIQAIGQAFREIFPKSSAQDLYHMTTSFRDFMQDMIPGQETLDRIKRTAAGFFAVLHIGWTIIKSVAGLIVDLFAGFGEGDSGVLKTTASIGDFLVKIDKMLYNRGAIENFFHAIRDAIFKVVNPIKDFGKIIGNLFDKFDSSSVSIGGFSHALNPLSSMGDKISAAWDKVKSIFGAVWKAFEPLASKMGGMFGGIGDAIVQAFSGLDYGSILSTINTGLFAGVVLMFKKFLSNFGRGEEKPGLLDSIKETLEGVTDTLKTMQTALKATTLLAIAAALALLVIAVVALSKIDPVALAKALTAMSVMFVQLGLALKGFEKIGTTGSMLKLVLMGGALILLAIAIDILASAVKKLSEMSMGDMLRGLLGLAIMLKLLSKTVESMSGNNGKMIRTAAGLILLSVAVKLLVSSVKDLSGMGWEEMAKGLVGVGALLGALALFTKFSKTDKGSISSGVGLILLAVAIKVLASAVKDMADMDWGQMARGLTGTAIGLVVISGAMKLMPDSSIGKAASILIVAGSLKLIAMALKDVGELDWGTVMKGLVGLGGALLAISIALNIIPKGAILSAISVAIVAASLLLIGNTLQQFSQMSWSEILKSMVMLGGTMLIITLAMNAMIEALPGAAAMLVVAASMAILAPVLLAFGQMSVGEIAKSLTMLAGAIIILGLGAVALGLVSPLILALGIAVAVLGAGIALIGGGVLALAVGLGMIAVAGGAAGTVLIALVAGLIGLIPYLIQQVGLGIIAFAQVIIDGGPAIVQALITILDSLITAVATEVPRVVDLVFNMILDILDTLESSIPQIIEKGANIIEAFLDGMNNRLPRIIDKATDLIVTFLDGISGNLPRIIDSAVNLITTFINGISNNLGRIIDAGINLVISFVNGVANGIRDHSYEMGQAGGNLASSIVEGMVKGIAGGVGSVITAAKNMASSALQAAKDFLDINSPSKKFIEVGKSVNEGFAKGIVGSKDDIKKAATDMTKTLTDAIAANRADVKQENEKLKGIWKDRVANIKEVEKAQKALRDAQNKEVGSTAKTPAARAAEIKRETDARNKAIDSAKDHLDKLNIKWKDYDDAVTKSQKTIANLNTEYDKLNAAKATLRNDLKDEIKKQESLADQLDKVNQKLDDAKQAYADAKKTRDDYNKSITDQYGTQETVTKDTKLKDYVKDLQQQIVDTQKFSVAIGELRKRGLNDEMYKQLLADGPENAMPFVQELLAGGAGAVKQINTLGSTLDTAAGKLGKTSSSSLYQAGVDAAKGVVDGLAGQKKALETQMKDLAKVMVDTIKKQLQIKSPSRVFKKLGGYSAEGLAKGLDASAGKVSKSAEGLGNTALDSMKKSITGLGDLIGGDVDANPVIKPVLDLSSVQKDATQIGSMLSAQPLTVDATYSTAKDASIGYQNNLAAMVEAMTPVEPAAPITFVQNNTSPKALSRAEIYRQTNNQLSVAKGALTSNAN